MAKEKSKVLGDKQTMEAKSLIIPNRQYQDNFFCSLFKTPKYRRAAYLLMHPEDADVQDSEFQNIELENIFTIDMYNDICFMVRGRLIILMEHQSTLNYNMPIRFLLYIAEEYKKLLSMKKYRKVLYSSALVGLPEPEFYMVYTGKSECPDQLNLSDAFMGSKGHFLNLTVTVYKEENAQGVIKEFISLIMLIKSTIADGSTMEDAIRKAIFTYRNGHEISDFFEGREDVFEMLGEALTLEEMLNLRDEANAEIITEQVTQQVTQQVTKQVMALDIRKAFKMMTSSGISSHNALQAIVKEYELPMDEVTDILQKV